VARAAFIGSTSTPPTFNWSTPRSRSALFSLDAARRYIAQSHTSLECLGELAIYDRQSRQQHIITQHNSRLLELHRRRRGNAST